jgi:dihydrofolate reductase
MKEAGNAIGRMTAIVAVDKNWAIGKDGRLLARISGDMKYFKEKTLGGVCVMGRRTFASLPSGPLPSRTNCVLTRNADFAAGKPWQDDIVIAHSTQEMMRKLNDLTGKIFIIGGGTVYRDFLPYVQTCLVTKIDAAFEADTFFPNLDTDEDFRLVRESDEHEENGYRYRFCEYRRV